MSCESCGLPQLPVAGSMFAARQRAANILHCHPNALAEADRGANDNNVR